MHSSTKIITGVVAIASVVLVLFLYLKPQEEKRHTDSEKQARMTETAPSQSRAPSSPSVGAATAVRAQSISSKSVTPNRLADSAASRARSAQPAGLEKQEPAPIRTTPEELIAKFTEDDPTQVFLPDTVRFHAAVDAEPIDPTWGPQTQASIQDFLRAQFGNDAEVVSADCRTDLCELHVVMPWSNDNRFGSAMSAMKQQPWWNQFQLDQDSLMMTSVDGQMVVIYFVSRK